MNQHTEKSKIELLAYELTYHRYLLNRLNTSAIFYILTMSEYIALHHIYHVFDNLSASKVYLRELSVSMNLSIHQISKMVRELKEKGLVRWQHDGDGDEGTYITITENGKEAMRQQTEQLKGYYGRVIEKFGYERVSAFLGELTALEQVLNSEIEGGNTDDAEIE